MNLYLLKFNNYYNRQVKKFDTLPQYASYVIGEPIQGVNFNPNDGVNTEQVINWNDEIPDYLIAAEANQIVSRWFVIEAVRTRAGQYKLILHRDLVVDEYDNIINAPLFVEKATLDASDPMIFNSENMSFNQIKTSETLLKDKSECPWIVGYFARTDGTSETELKGSVKTTVSPDFIIDGPIEDWEYNDLLNKDIATTGKEFNLEFSYNSKNVNPIVSGNVFVSLINDYKHVGQIVGTNPSTPLFFDGSVPSKENILKPFVEKKEELKKYALTIAGTTTEQEFTQAYNLISRIIQYKDNGVTVYKRIVKGSSSSEERYKHYINTSSGGLYTTFLNCAAQIGLKGTPNNNQYCIIDGYISKFKLALEDIQAATFDYSIPKNRIHPYDVPYDMFCIPFSDTLKINNVLHNGNRINIVSKKSLMLNIATSIAEQQGAKIYDLQLLPYCPVQGVISDKGEIDLMQYNNVPSENSPAQYSNITLANPGQGVGVLQGIILFVSSSTFNFEIPLEKPITITEPKIQSECDMYRLNSPNYAASFQFNAAKNGGVKKFNVDCTYLPYNPYIHLNPNFGVLYGKDFGDSRGLICGGDFSISVVSDAWTQFQLNNKNYQASFDRQIQNMEVNNAVQREREIWGLAGGSASGGASGAIIGSMFGPVGTAVGAAIGTGISALGGLKDLELNDKLRNEQMDYTKDQFGYQLGNIKAMPDTLSKTTAYTANNKYFPFLEYYTCTEKEKEALRNKIKYNGMTVMRVGRIYDFLQDEPTYIKGQLIRCDEISDDFNYVKAIAAELNQGIFI